MPIEDLTPHSFIIIPSKDKIEVFDPESDPSLGLGAQVGGLGGTSAKAVSDAINNEGNLVTDIINARLNSEAKTILGEFTFNGSGAIAIATDANNGIWISPAGIIGKNSGISGGYSFTIDNSGNATFYGTLSAAAGTLGVITTCDITGGTFKTGTSGKRTWITAGQVEMVDENDKGGIILTVNTVARIIDFADLDGVPAGYLAVGTAGVYENDIILTASNDLYLRSTGGFLNLGVVGLNPAMTFSNVSPQPITAIVPLDIQNSLQCDSLRIDQTPATETITPDKTITISCNGTNYKIAVKAA